MCERGPPADRVPEGNRAAVSVVFLSKQQIGRDQLVEWLESSAWNRQSH